MKRNNLKNLHHGDSNGNKTVGRRIFETLFPSEMTDKQLKIIANATGIQQTGTVLPQGAAPYP